MQTVIKNLPLKMKSGARSQKPELFRDDASGMASLEERARQRELIAIDLIVTVALVFVAFIVGFMLRH